MLTPEEIIEQERQRAEQAELQLNQERQQTQQKQQDAIAQLSSLGLSVEQIAGALGLSVEDVNSPAHKATGLFSSPESGKSDSSL